jgi:hypothetical protein
LLNFFVHKNLFLAYFRQKISKRNFAKKLFRLGSGFGTGSSKLSKVGSGSSQKSSSSVALIINNYYFFMILFEKYQHFYRCLSEKIYGTTANVERFSGNKK